MAYPGGKNGAGVYQKIINLMPPHETYIEPFLGGGAVMRLKRPARLNMGLDLCGSAIAAFGGAGLGVATNVNSAGAVPEYSIGGTGDNTRSGARRHHRSPNLASSDGSIATGDARSLIVATGEASSFRFECRDGLEYLEAAASKTAMCDRALVYCDPPYLMSTRSGRKIYEHEMSEGDHRRLLSALQALSPNTMVMISGYWSHMYAEALAGWHSISFEAMTRAGRTATEWLWFNFPPPLELHDYRYLGEGFRERERIKRKKLRWVTRLARMPILERQSLFAAMAEHKSAA